MGILAGTKRHIEDCVNVHYEFRDKKKENHIDPIIKPMQKLSKYFKCIITDENSKEIIIAYRDLAFQAEMFCWNEGALDFYSEAVRLQKETRGDQGDFVHLLCKLANTYFKVNKYDDTIKCYKWAMANEQKRLGDAPKVAKIMKNIAQVHWKAKKFESSLSSYNELLQMQEMMFGQENLDVAKTYNNIGLVHHILKQFDRAMLYFFKAIRITKDLQEKNHSFLSELYCNLGKLYCETDDYKTALITYDEAIKYGVKFTAKNDDAVARAHHGKGITLAKMNDLENAISSYEKSLLITKVEICRQPKRVAKVLQDLASVYYESQNYGQVLEKLIEVKEILNIDEDQRSEQKSNIHRIIADCYERLGNYKEAIDNYQIVIDNEKNRLGDTVEVADLLQHMGDVCVLDESKELAVKCFQEALEIRTDSDEYPLEVAALRHRLGTMLSKMNEKGNAMQNMKEALRIRYEQLGEDHELVSDTLFKMALICKDSEEYDSALELYRKALDIRVAQLGSSHIKVADTLYNVGIVQVKLNDTKNAIVSFEEAFKTNLELGVQNRDDKLDNIVEWLSFLRNESMLDDYSCVEVPL